MFIFNKDKTKMILTIALSLGLLILIVMRDYFTKFLIYYYMNKHLHSVYCKILIFPRSDLFYGRSDTFIWFVLV